MTKTEKARAFIARGFSNREIASQLSLHEAYVRKIRQRSRGNEPAWHAWRQNNPAKVRAYRHRQDLNRQPGASTIKRIVTK